MVAKAQVNNVCIRGVDKLATSLVYSTPTLNGPPLEGGPGRVDT